jgi:hypothetical protein
MSVQQVGTDIRALRELEDFPLVEALFGRRSRRFARGGEIPDGPLAYRSGHEPVPLSEPAEEPYVEGHNAWCVNVPDRCWSSRWPTSPST